MQRLAFALGALTLGISTPSYARQAYDPLAVPSARVAAPVELVVHDASRRRDIPILVYVPAGSARAPVVLFSHGLGGSRSGSAYLGEHWAARGYVAVFVQHPGSDDSVWEGKPPAERMQAMKAAASFEQFRARVKDVPAVLDQLERWNATVGSPLAGRLDLQHLAMSGHSFGAVTTQALSGQRFPLGLAFTDPRIKAAIIMSPSVPRRGSNAASAFSRVAMPWMLMTGTHDVAPIGDQDAASRLGVYPALPPGRKYELVLDGAEHSAFTDRALPGDQLPRNSNHHRVILALSTAFLDAYLRDDAAARAWLDGDGPRRVLEPRDRWQHK